MTKVLKVLDEMEEVRQRVNEKPENYPADYLARVMCAIVADAYGYESRLDWTEELKKHKESKHFQRLENGTFKI